MLERLAHEKGPTLKVTRESLGTIFSEHQLEFLTKDLPAAEASDLKATAGVILLRGSGTDGMKLAKQLAAATRDVADAAHGWVLDPETFQILGAAAFHDHVPGDRPDVSKLIVVHSIVGDNEQPFLDTAGLRRYGFPELYVPEAPSGQINQITHLINGAAQALLDGTDVNERGEIAVDFHKLGWKIDIIGAGTGKAVWSTRWARERDATDDDDLVVELVPPAGAGTEGITKLVDQCFGFAEELARLKANDPELIAAGERARADLVKLRSHFAHGIPYEERLTIKAKFTGDDDQTEWMWVDVVSFNGDEFEGTLANEPEMLKSLRDGQKVKVKLADVADYLHEKKGGEPTGGYSLEVVKKRGLLPADAN